MRDIVFSVIMCDCSGQKPDPGGVGGDHRGGAALLQPRHQWLIHVVQTSTLTQYICRIHNGLGHTPFHSCEHSCGGLT